MIFNHKKKISNVFILIASCTIVSLILWNTNSFFKTFKEEERHKMEIWASAMAEFLSLPADADPGNLHIKIFQKNTSTPMILVNRDGSTKINNIPKEQLNDTAYIHKKIKKLKLENRPITIDYKGENLATLYYGNSEVLNKLKYYPIALLLIMFLFIIVIFFFFKTNKTSEQNKLWVGMAKETAHQIGTPLSSLLGWNELLKTENIDPEITTEIEKDIARLETITDRFSKIGSLPKLDVANIVEETENAYKYLKSRSSKLILFSFESNIEELAVLLTHFTTTNQAFTGLTRNFF